MVIEVKRGRFGAGVSFRVVGLGKTSGQTLFLHEGLCVTYVFFKLTRCLYLHIQTSTKCIILVNSDV